MNTRSTFYQEGQHAFFDGLNDIDVTKFYPENSFEANEWLQGMRDAKYTADVTGIPKHLLKPFNGRIREELEALNRDWDKASAAGDEIERAVIERKMAAILALIDIISDGKKI